jgi:hypothetical protein
LPILILIILAGCRIGSNDTPPILMPDYNTWKANVEPFLNINTSEEFCKKFNNLEVINNSSRDYLFVYESLNQSPITMNQDIFRRTFNIDTVRETFPDKTPFGFQFDGNGLLIYPDGKRIEVFVEGKFLKVRILEE